MIDLDQHTDVLSDPTAADEGRLNELHDTLTARVDELRPKIADRTLSDDELGELGRITPALRDVTGERTNRHAAREQQYGDAEAFLSEFDASQAPAEESDETAEGESEADEQTDENGEESGAEQTEQVPVAASAGKGKRPATTTKPRVPAIGTTGAHADNGPAKGGSDGRIPTSLVAATHSYGRSAGSPMKFEEIGGAMAQKLRSLRNGGGDGSDDPVVTFRANGTPETRYLKLGEPGRNTNKLDAVTSQPALVAAGGLCAPLAIDYSYQSTGVQGRPVRDSLPGFQADRGGIQFRPDVSPVTNTNNNGPRSATGVWTNDNDEHAYDVSTPPRKAVWYVDCPDTQTAEVEAITLQTEWSNVTSRFDPETVQANQAAALIWHDRFAENRLLAQLQGMSKVMTADRALGAVCDVLVTLDRAQSYFRSVHRLGGDVQLRAIMPFWLIHLIRADFARRMALDPMAALNISDAQITSLLQTRGLNPVWHLDGNSANDTMGTSGSTTDDVPAQQYTLAANNSAVPAHPAKVDILLHAEGCFTHLDGGTLDLGIVRDSALIDRNRYRQFSETWEGVAKRGVEALRLVQKVWPTGETSGASSTDLSAK